MESSLEITIQFVELIRKHPVIYDGTIKYLRNPDAHIAAWEEVAARIGATTAQCKKWWKKLRSSLCRKVRDNNHKVKPDGIEPHLSFLIPIVRPKNAEGPELEDRLDYNVTFVNLVRMRPSLYNGTHPQSRPTLWEEVAQQLREAYPASSASGAECKRRWEKFRYSYNIFLRKGYRFRPWGIERHFRFLIPYLQYRVPDRVDAFRAARQLIDLVRSYPCLYDGSDRHAKTYAWEAVAKGMGEAATPLECLRKWLKLRDGFQRHLRDGKDLHPRGIEEELRFLEPYLSTEEPLAERGLPVDEDELFVMQFVEDMGRMSASQNRLFRIEAIRAAREILDG
ncbi:uncharacterized protein LOC119765113 [Culex quinquefasciatus]|uniref:uncharacterized protein LOC119765113 n=1 Tax=Culex quinquefasciatus TaxID=7176 RepID=UPI0018E2E06B|nr:uncharacterized protein LOC119765113 [Culex quinquefasciatus]